jgi:hypothetical protein
MSIEQINSRDVKWPDEREPYVPRHRGDAGRARPLGHVWRTGVHAEGTGRQTMRDWWARSMERAVTLLNEAVAR